MLKANGRGFTIVELLIVIVVIAILAAITIVAYNGVTRQAKESTAKLGASQASQKVKAYSVDNEENFPTSLLQVGIQNSGSTTYLYSADNDVSPSTFCVTATSGDQVFHMDQDATGPQAGPCSQHGASITNLLPDPSATLVSNFTISGGTGNLSVETDGTAYAGSTYLRKAFTSTTVPAAQILPDIPITEGEAYTFSCWVRNTAGRTLTARINWRNGSGSQISETIGAVGTSSASWARTSATAAIAPENAAFARPRVTSNSTFSNGTTFDVDACMLTAGSTLHTYADGDSPNWSWSGTPHASTSSGPAL